MRSVFSKASTTLSESTLWPAQSHPSGRRPPCSCWSCKAFRLDVPLFGIGIIEFHGSNPSLWKARSQRLTTLQSVVFAFTVCGLPEPWLAQPPRGRTKGKSRILRLISIACSRMAALGCPSRWLSTCAPVFFGFKEAHERNLWFSVG